MPRSTLYAILLHPEQPAVFLTPTPDGWSLPCLVLEETVWLRAKVHLNSAWQEHLELPVTILYVAGYEKQTETDEREVVHLLENHSSVAEPALEGHWFDRDRLLGLSLARPQHRPIIDRHLAQAESGRFPPERQPWSRPGWFRQAAGWMKSELARLGYILTGPPRLMNYWSLSCVMCAPTTRGDIYFKVAADLPLFVNEPAVLSGLSHLYPDMIPAPLVTDVRRGWMLLQDFGAALDETPSLETHIEMLLTYGKLQREAAAQVDELLALGCIDRRLPVLARQLDGLLQDEAALQGLAEPEVVHFRAAAPRLKAMCQELAQFGIPPSLMHGDLHLGNVARRNGHMLFFDWTDACVGHPFLDMVSIFDEKDEGLRTLLRDEYLAHWSDYGSKDELRRAWRLAERLSALHQAVSYQYILGNLDDVTKKGFGDIIPRYVRWALTE